MQLDTAAKANGALQKLMRDYKAEKIDGTRFRNLVHAFSVLLSFYKFIWESEQFTDLEERIEIIERQLENRETQKSA